MSPIDEAIAIARKAAETSWKTPYIRQLVLAAEQLDNDDLKRLQHVLRQVDRGLKARLSMMARVVAPCSTKKANTIIDAMTILFGARNTKRALRAVGYQTDLVDCAQKLARRGRDGQRRAVELLEHIRDTVGISDDAKALLSEINYKPIIPSTSRPAYMVA